MQIHDEHLCKNMCTTVEKAYIFPLPDPCIEIDFMKM